MLPEHFTHIISILASVKTYYLNYMLVFLSHNSFCILPNDVYISYWQLYHIFFVLFCLCLSIFTLLFTSVLPITFLVVVYFSLHFLVVPEMSSPVWMGLWRRANPECWPYHRGASPGKSGLIGIERTSLVLHWFSWFSLQNDPKPKSLPVLSGYTLD